MTAKLKKTKAPRKKPAPKPLYASFSFTFPTSKHLTILEKCGGYNTRRIFCEEVDLGWSPAEKIRLRGEVLAAHPGNQVAPDLIFMGYGVYLVESSGQMFQQTGEEDLGAPLITLAGVVMPHTPAKP